MMSTRQKIVFVNRYFYPDHSATSQILSDLAFDLVEAGLTIEVVTSDQLYDNPKMRLPANESVRGVKVHRVSTSHFGRGSLAGRATDYLTFYLTAARMMWKCTDSNTILVAKTDPPMVSLVAAVIARLKGATLVNWLQDLFPEVAYKLGVPMMNKPVVSFLRWVRNWTLQVAGTNVVLGSQMAAVVQAQGVPERKVCLIPNWADGIAIKPLPHQANELRTKWDMSKKFVVGYSGNLGRAHEFDTIIDAADALRHRTDISFLFIGGGARLEYLQQEVTRRSLDNVHFKPYQLRERLRESLCLIDIHLVSLNPVLEGLVVPSKFYGIAAAGRPTIFIGDQKGELPTIIGASMCGTSVTSGDWQLLSSQITRYADDLSIYKEACENARQLFEARYCRSRVVKQWLSLLGNEKMANLEV